MMETCRAFYEVCKHSFRVKSQTRFSHPMKKKNIYIYNPVYPKGYLLT